MELNEMNLQDVELRIAELDSQVETSDDVDFVNGATEEKRNLMLRKQELIDLEERKANAKALNDGNVKPDMVMERKKKMEEIRTYGVGTPEYRSAYLSNLMGKEISVEERTALTSASNVIPTETTNKIYGKLMENPLIAELEMTHFAGYVSVPKATAVNDASFVAMGTGATDGADVVGAVSLGAKKLIKTIEITADIESLSIDAFETWLVGKLVQKMERAICNAVLNGAGNTTNPQGITPTLTAISGATSVTKANLLKLLSAVGSAYHNGACFVMTSAMFYGKVVDLASDSNGILIMNGLEKRLFGHKVVLDDNAGSNIVFGNFKEGYVFNMAKEIEIKADGSVAFRSGSVVYRAMALCDGGVADGEAFAMITIA